MPLDIKPDPPPGRKMSFAEALRYAREKNPELMKDDWSDYDENGVPYWEKWDQTAQGNASPVEPPANEVL